MRKTFESRAWDLLQAIEDACQEIPDNWKIQVCIQKDGAFVLLLDEDLDSIEYPSNHERTEDSIIDALAFAKQKHFNKQE